MILALLLFSTFNIITTIIIKSILSFYFMLGKEGVVPTRREIEANLTKMGDYVKMHYLQTSLKQHIDFDTRKFVLGKLSALYESRAMFADSAKLMKDSANINTTFGGKMSDFVKSAELFIKAGNFNEADLCFDMAIGCAENSQKNAIRNIKKGYYINLAKTYEVKNKRRNALEVYEKIRTLELDQNEKIEIEKSILDLYEKLGKVRDYMDLKSRMERSENY